MRSRMDAADQECMDRFNECIEYNAKFAQQEAEAAKRKVWMSFILIGTALSLALLLASLLRKNNPNNARINSGTAKRSSRRFAMVIKISLNHWPKLIQCHIEAVCVAYEVFDTNYRRLPGFFGCARLLSA